MRLDRDLNILIKKGIIKKYYDIDLFDIKGVFEINFCENVFIKIRACYQFDRLSKQQISQIVNHPLFKEVTIDENLSFKIAYEYDEQRDCLKDTDIEDSYERLEDEAYSYINKTLGDYLK